MPLLKLNIWRKFCGKSKSQLFVKVQFDLLCGSSNIFRSDVADKTFDIRRLLNSVPEHITEANLKLIWTLISNRFHACA